MHKSRLARTILLGAIVAALGTWWLAKAYEVESATLLGFLLSSALFVAGAIVLALAGAAIVRTLRRRRPRIGLIGKDHGAGATAGAREDR